MSNYPIIIGFLTVANTVVLFVLLKKILSLGKGTDEGGARFEALLKTEFSGNRDEYEKKARSMREEFERSQKSLREEIAKNINEFNRTMTDNFEKLSNAHGKLFGGFKSSLESLSKAGLESQETLKNTVEKRLEKIQNDNEKQLEKMRSTVEEKLQGTLEKRLSQSFKQVEENLRQVHQGLGEMQNLAQGVGDLKKVLTNVKTRGTWGEFQLGNILEEILSPDQYEKNVSIKKNSVEYAVKLPGQGLDKGSCIYLPIDSKFPQEDYQRLLDAQEQSDPVAFEAASSSLQTSIRREAGKIKDKYIAPPETTDFAVMFLPTEGLYAEVLRRPGLAESVQRDFRIIITGPTNFAALVNSLSVGFRTLAIQKRSSEVWQLLGTVKGEFGKFSDLLDGVRKKLNEASNKMEDVSRKSRTIEGKLKKVEQLPDGRVGVLMVDEADKYQNA